jgi:hypothetical protein
MTPLNALICGYCGYCGSFLEAKHARKSSFFGKLYFLTLLGLKQSPQSPQYPQPCRALSVQGPPSNPTSTAASDKPQRATLLKQEPFASSDIIWST